MNNIIWTIAAPIVTRYAIASIGSAVAGAGAYATAKLGVSTETVAAIGAGVAAAGTVVIMAVSKNKNAAAIIARLPVKEALDAIANASKAKVKSIVVTDKTLADSVPSAKVVASIGTGGTAI